VRAASKQQVSSIAVEIGTEEQYIAMLDQLFEGAHLFNFRSSGPTPYHSTYRPSQVLA
jgi:hypothetical protein